MAGLLLDTNILILLIGEKPLPAAQKRAISAPGAQLVVSVASLWEIAIKSRLGKLTLRFPAEALGDFVEGIGAALLVIDARHAVTAAEPEPPTRDPFDRLLLAQAQVEDLRLVTLDRALAGHPLAWRKD
jgi:PIN domain nuclease of toxin-antitoxin system